MELAGKFEDIGNGSWKLKLGNNTGKFLSCPNKQGEGKWVESDKKRYDQYYEKMLYCKDDGRTETLYNGITSESLKQFGITIDEKGNLYYSLKTNKQ